jgi:putative FmdB family regulatory protein
MPVYDIVCDNCGRKEEIFLKIDENPPACDKCGLPMRKTMSAPAFVLKGRRWASDNYGLKDKGRGNKDGKKRI